MIPVDDVSVVVQGPVHGLPGEAPEKQLTQRALASARAAWPDGELILSTWKGADTTHLRYDKLILNDDPGAIAHNDTADKPVFNNLNRQITTTRNGLAAATRRFAVKLRSDCELLAPVDFRPIFEGPRQPRWSVLEGRVIVLNVYTRHPLRRPVLFHLSDIFHAGLREDLVKLWSAPLVGEPAFTRSRPPARRPRIDIYPRNNYLFRCAPEQYLGEQLARRLDPGVHLRSIEDGSIGELFLWLRLLANNFCLVTPVEAGVALPKRMSGAEAGWDLFRPDERPWLSRWAQPVTPLAIRWRTAVCYLAARGKFRLPQPYQSTYHRILKYIFRIDLAR